jgi:DNA-binding PadR family transcriptional regulator
MYIDILILAELASRPYHGYELKRHVERLLGGGMSMNANQLYPSLRRFEAMGVVSRRIERQVGKPDRHIYSLTDRGREKLLELLQDFPPDLARNPSEFGARVAFFHLLEPHARLAILATRKEVLRDHLHFLEQSQALLDTNVAQSFYVHRLLSFQQQQMQEEVAWITCLQEEMQP